jgi:hypothetical protein
VIYAKEWGPISPHLINPNRANSITECVHLRFTHTLIDDVIFPFKITSLLKKGMGKSGKIGEKKPQGKRYNSKHVCKESQPFPETTL